MSDVENLLDRSLSLIEKSIKHLESLSLDEKVKPNNIATLCKLTTSLLQIKKQHSSESGHISKMSDDEIDQQLLEQFNQLEKRGYKLPNLKEKK